MFTYNSDDFAGKFGGAMANTAFTEQSGGNFKFTSYTSASGSTVNFATWAEVSGTASNIFCSFGDLNNDGAYDMIVTGNAGGSPLM